ncbi:MAG: glycosyltransferase [Bacteroidota bacterium]
MTLLLQLIFSLCILGMLHSYLLFPLILRWLTRGKQTNQLHFDEDGEWPEVRVIMAVYNEEKVIQQKMESLLAMDYPVHKLKIYVGSDCSTDATNAILRSFQAQNNNLTIFPFQKRRGKPGQVNEIVSHLVAEEGVGSTIVYLMTDASVMIPPASLKKMVRHFRNPKIALVDAHMRSTGLQQEGISRSENKYVGREVQLKQWESIWKGQMIGPFGGCYAIRSDYFTPVPPNYLVDDFFICMKALEKGGMAINDLEAVCYEAISHDIGEEFRRKSRISAGNFQNLRNFRHLANPLGSTLGFAFFSHKVLRWMGPFFIIFAFISSLLLALDQNKLFLYLLYMQGMVLFVVPMLDWLFRQLKVNNFWLRSITYLLVMNLALLNGFFKYLKGIKTNVWQPTKRH